VRVYELSAGWSRDHGQKILIVDKFVLPARVEVMQPLVQENPYTVSAMFTPCVGWTDGVF